MAGSSGLICIYFCSWPGFMTANEKKIFDDLNLKTPHPKYWMPLVWAGSIIARARKEGRIRDDFAVKTIIDSINRFRGLCGGLLNYDWISVPLVYTQVVTLAVYSFFLGTLFGRQFVGIDEKSNNVDLYVPYFTFLQFFFYMGWLKVAETLVNPFGEDDDDFEVNWLVDRNLQVSYLIVDEMHSEHPELIQDMYWDEVFPQELPYTIASEQFRKVPHMGSTINLQVPELEQEFLPPLEEIEEETTVDEEKNVGKSKARTIVRDTISNGSVASSPGIGSRKPSALSIILNKILFHQEKEQKEKRHKSVGKHLSSSKNSLSLKRANRLGLERSTSRISSSSHVSPRSFDRTHTNNSMQDCDVFQMSFGSLIESPEDSPIINSAKKANAEDVEEQLFVKHKQENKEGRNIIASLSEEPETASSSSQACLLARKTGNSELTDTLMQEGSAPSSSKEIGSFYIEQSGSTEEDETSFKSKENDSFIREIPCKGEQWRKKPSFYISSSASQNSYNDEHLRDKMSGVHRDRLTRYIKEHHPSRQPTPKNVSPTHSIKKPSDNKT